MKPHDVFEKETQSILCIKKHWVSIMLMYIHILENSLKRYKKQMNETSNSSVYKKAKRKHVCDSIGKCSICPMHGGENASRKGKHGVKKPRKKDKRG